MRNKSRSLGPELARIASRQHGVITAAQLVGAGLSRAGVTRRVQRGDLHRVHFGVYRVGHVAPSVEADYLAAVLACGERAYLAGLAAAHLLRLVRNRPPVPEVVVVGEHRHPGLITHRMNTVPFAEVSVYRGIPVTTVPRTLVDLAPRLGFDELAAACHEADVLHGTAPGATLAIARGRPGAQKLRAILDGDHPTVLSRLEKLFLAALAADVLPRPITNRPQGAHYVDCRWPGRRLTVELDSYRFHHTRHAWEQDRERERAARARGDEFRRYTWRDVAEEPAPMLADLRRLLTERR